MPSRRDTILEAAIELFASRGFGATSINDIERAAGLSVGSGGTYRHFRSKEAMLETAIEELLEDLHARLDPDPPSLEAGFQDSIDFVRDNKQLFRILTRDLGDFPDLRARVVEELLGHSFRLAADRTATFAPHLDVEAVATMLGNAAVGFALIEILADWRPFDIDDERFVSILSAVYLHLLTSESE